MLINRYVKLLNLHENIKPHENRNRPKSHINAKKYNY